MRDAADVIIPVHGRADTVAACLAALERGDADGIGCVYVVDDASPPNEARRLRELSEGRRFHVERLTLGVRSGFVPAANAGWRASGSPVAILLNDDTVPAPGALCTLRDVLTGAPDVAAVAPTSDNPRDLFQYRSAPAVARGLTPASYLTAMCLALRRSAVGATLFDAAYSPGYFEDLDLCCRLRASGWRLAIAEHALVRHIGGATFSADDGWRSAFARNYGTFTARWGWLPTHATLEDALVSAGALEGVTR